MLDELSVDIEDAEESEDSLYPSEEMDDAEEPEESDESEDPLDKDEILDSEESVEDELDEPLDCSDGRESIGKTTLLRIDAHLATNSHVPSIGLCHTHTQTGNVSKSSIAAHNASVSVDIENVTTLPWLSKELFQP